MNREYHRLMANLDQQMNFLYPSAYRLGNSFSTHNSVLKSP